MWQNKRQLFSLLFEASAAALLDVAVDPKHLGAQLGFLSILHTWGQTLTPHPHIHCVVPGGGLAPDHARWIASRSSFLLPVKVLSRVFRGKFVAGLRRLFASDQLRFFGECMPLHEEKRFALFLRTLYRQDWVVYAKPPFGGPEHVLHYLARYTHRVAISNHRLLSVSAAEVCFRWKDYAHHSKQRTLTLASEEFLRRFVQHVLPRGFPVSATSASSPTADEPACCHSAALCSNRPLLPKRFRRKTHTMEVPALPWTHASRRTALGRTTLLRPTKGGIPA